jgi:O-acetyl-ADP-ribose deacetylase (regulator of RNase III)
MGAEPGFTSRRLCGSFERGRDEMKATFGKTKVEVVLGDITRLQVDAIVNAANSRLRGGGGVDGAIHRAGGPKILEECMAYDGCPTGEAVHTTAGAMPSRWVIHTVGPVWHGGDRGEEALLASCYRNALKKALELGARTVAFPSISTGIYGYPFDDACRVALRTIRDVVGRGVAIDRVLLVAYGEGDFRRYGEIMRELLAS